ncbi:hypothetical protein Bca4012_051406 [Brassica carinata]
MSGLEDGFSAEMLSVQGYSYTYDNIFLPHIDFSTDAVSLPHASASMFHYRSTVSLRQCMPCPSPTWLFPWPLSVEPELCTITVTSPLRLSSFAMAHLSVFRLRSYSNYQNIRLWSFLELDFLFGLRLDLKLKPNTFHAYFSYLLKNDSCSTFLSLLSH